MSPKPGDRAAPPPREGEYDIRFADNQVAVGATTSGAIAGQLGRDAATVAHPLSVLADMCLVARRDDALRARRPTWQITDPLPRLYAAVMRRDWARLEQGRAREVWRDAEPTWRSRVLGPHLEQLARDWATDHAAELVPAGMSRVGSAVLADAARRSNHEIDIVGLGIPGTVRPVVLLGEVKHQRQPMGAAELDRLGRIRDLFDRQGKATPDIRLLLVSAAGFTPELEVRQQAGEVLPTGPGDLLNAHHRAGRHAVNTNRPSRSGRVDLEDREAVQAILDAER